jgi:raffinose synthase
MTLAAAMMIGIGCLAHAGGAFARVASAPAVFARNAFAPAVLSDSTHAGDVHAHVIVLATRHGQATVTLHQKDLLEGAYAVLEGNRAPVKIETLIPGPGNVVVFYLSADSGPKEDTGFAGLFFKRLPGYRTGTAFYRYPPYSASTIPVQVKTMDNLKSGHMEFFIWQYTDGTYGAAMPLGGNGYCAELGSNSPGPGSNPAAGERDFGVKSVSLFRGTPVNHIPVLAITFGRNPYKMIDELYAAGMQSMGEKACLRRNKVYPPALENIGWCTWNAYGSSVNREKVMEGVRSFSKLHFPLPLVLIDDGWLDIRGGRLESFRPDSSKFPGGFRPLADSLRGQYGVKDLGVWHAINGYWGGIDRNAPFGKKYGSLLSDTGYRFYEDWYAYLEGQGVSLVKVDNQVAIDKMAMDNMPLWETGKRLETDVQRAAGRHFNGAVINSMEMTVYALYHYQRSSVGRASEDFLPNRVSYDMLGGNEAVHVLGALCNSLWMSEMVWPDFDMFQSHHADALYAAVARAVSGGPVYLTDIPGQQRTGILWPLVYRNGRIIRTDMPARPTEDCLFQGQDALPFKAFALSRHAGLLAAFNVADKERVEGYFKAADVYGLKGTKFAVYDFFARAVRVVGPNTAIPLSLERMGCRLFFVVPVYNNAAIFGLTNKYNAPGTILAQHIAAHEVSVDLPEGGTLGLYLATVPKRVLVDGRALASEEGRVQPSSDSRALPAGAWQWKKNLLEINIPDLAGISRRRVQIFF